MLGKIKIPGEPLSAIATLEHIRVAFWAPPVFVIWNVVNLADFEFNKSACNIFELFLIQFFIIICHSKILL